MGNLKKNLATKKGRQNVTGTKVINDKLEVKTRDLLKLDDFANFQTSQGTSKDKKMASFVTGYILDVFQLDLIYQQSDIAASCVDIPAFESMRQGYKIILDGPDSDDNQLIEALMTEMQANHVNQKVTFGEVFGKLYGGGGIFMGVNDGLNPWDPLDLSKIKSVDYLVLLDRYELVNSGIIDMSVASENFARPEYYQLATIDPRMAGMKIHNSRVVRFEGVQLSRRRMATFQYWGQSVINRIYNIIRDFESSTSSLASMIQDFNLMIFKISELTQVVAGSSEGQALIQQRLNMAAQMGSILNALVIRPQEDIDFRTRNVSGLDAVYDRLTERLVMAAGVPRLLLLGQGKGGLNTNTDNEVRMFYDRIKCYQEQYVEPKLRRLIEVFMAAKTGAFKGEIKDFRIKFNPLWQLSETELADVKFKMAQTDNLYLVNDVITPDEVAESRFGTGHYCTETFLDEKLRGIGQQGSKPANLTDPNLPKERPYPMQPNPMGGIASASGSYPQKPLNPSDREEDEDYEDE